LLSLISFSSFSYDSTKLHVRLKIMDPSMAPIHSDSNDCPNTSFQTWMIQHKVKKLIKVFTNSNDTFGELEYRYMMFHDSNAFVLASALDTMSGVKEVFIYDFQPYSYSFPNCTTSNSFTPNDPFISTGKNLRKVPNFLPNDDYDRFAHMEDSIDLTWFLDRIDAKCAWDLTKGDSNVLIGIVDSYIDTSHEDFYKKFKIWKHWDTIHIKELLDSFRITSGNIDDKKFSENWYTLKKSASLFYHGTMCAGAAAANIDNGIGVSGIGGNCKLAGYSFLGYGPTGPDPTIEGWTDLDKVIKDAIDNDGVKVINCSWGPAIGPAYFYKDSSNIMRVKFRAGFLMEEIVKYGISKGVVFTMAGGNNYRFNNQFEALPSSQFVQAEGAIIVGGSYIHGPNNPNHLDRLYPEFNHAEYIDLCAPLDIATTKMQYNPAYPGQASAGGKNRLQAEYYTFGYGFGGTSASSALVSGIVGLMFSVNPNLSPSAIECLLKAGCEPMDYTGYENQQVVTIPSNHLGAGRVNAYNSVYLAKGDGGSLYGTVEWNELHHISSNLILEPSCTLTIKYKTLISPNRKIVVKPGARLILDGTVTSSLTGAILTNLCGDGAWGGIVVLGDPTKIQTSAFQGVVEIKNGAIIENAIEGVRVVGYKNDGSIDVNTSNGIIWATNASFKNNMTDVVILGATKLANQNIKNLSHLKNCNFITNGENKISSLREHVRLTSCNLILFEGCKFEDLRSIIPKSQGRVGINALDATFIIKDYLNGTDTTQSNFKNLKIGINSIGHPVDMGIMIQNTTFKCYKGAFLLGSTNARIINNTFKIESEPYSFPATDYPYGLYLDFSNKFDLESNHFIGINNSGMAGEVNAGLVIRNSGANSNEFYRSFFDSITVASQAIEENKDGTFPAKGLKFRCNEYSTNKNDFDIVPEFSILQGMNIGVSALQGSKNIPADNLFNNAISWNINNNVVDGLTYFHQNVTLPNLLIPSLNSNIDLEAVSNVARNCPNMLGKGTNCSPCWFRTPISVNRTNMNSMNSSWKSQTDNGNTKTLINQISNVNSGNVLVLYNQLMNFSPWLSLRTLAKIAETEVEFSDLQIKNILVANPHSGRSDWIMNILNNRNIPLAPFYIADIIDASNTYTERDSIFELVSDANTKYDLILNELLTYYLKDTLEHIATLDSFLRHPTNPNYRYQLANIYFNRNQYSEYQNILDSIPTQIYLNNEQASFHGVYSDFFYQIKLWKQDSIPLPILDSSQLSWLKNFYEINLKIPAYGISLLAINDTSFHASDPVFISDTTSFIPPLGKKGSTLKVEDVSQKLTRIFPNPTNKFITIELISTINSFQAINIEIIDGTGKVVITKDWPTSINFVKFEINSLKSGVYYCNIISNSKLLETHKIILTK
jgi:subtilisin family serine protease